MVESAPNTTNITNVTITRNNDANRSIVNYELYFSGGNTIKGSMSFSPGETQKKSAVGVYPYTNDQRAGGSVTAVETENKFYVTGFQVYENRQKRLGGQIVLTEPNLRGVGEGPYFEAPLYNKYDDRACLSTFTNESPSRVAYANSELSFDYYKNNCGSGFNGSRETYSVAAGKYTSAVSQDDANSKAKAEADANGQAMANTKGSCYKP